MRSRYRHRESVRTTAGELARVLRCTGFRNMWVGVHGYRSTTRRQGCRYSKISAEIRNSVHATEAIVISRMLFITGGHPLELVMAREQQSLNARKAALTRHGRSNEIKRRFLSEFRKECSGPSPYGIALPYSIGDYPRRNRRSYALLELRPTQFEHSRSITENTLYREP